MESVVTPCVCTTLRMTTRAINRLYDAELRDTGLRATGYTILARLFADGPMSIAQLARRLSLERSTCSREVAPLVQAGLVELSTGGDRRVRIAGLSTTGTERYEAARPHWARAQQKVAERFGAGDVEDLLVSLRGLLAAAEA